MNYNNLFDFKYNLTIISIKISIVILTIFLILRLVNILPQNIYIISIIVFLIFSLFLTYKHIVKYPYKLYLIQTIIFLIVTIGLFGISVITKKFIVLIWIDFLLISSHILSNKKTAFIFFILSLSAEIFLFFTYFREYDFFNKITIIVSLIFFNILGFLVATQLEKYSYENEAQKVLLEKITMIDFLTDTYNRRAFFKLSKIMISEAIREEKNIGIIMMDIDFFKRINDNFGHCAGDAILKSFAYTIKKNIRKNDLFARIGGEEFVLLIKNPTQKSLKTFAKKLMDYIRDKDIKLDENIINITVSMGLYIFNPKYESLEEAINKADKALYEAKEKRDRFIFYGESQ